MKRGYEPPIDPLCCAYHPIGLLDAHTSRGGNSARLAYVTHKPTLTQPRASLARLAAITDVQKNARGVDAWWAFSKLSTAQ